MLISSKDCRHKCHLLPKIIVQQARALQNCCAAVLPMQRFATLFQRQHLRPRPADSCASALDLHAQQARSITRAHDLRRLREDVVCTMMHV
jgi:hypothetical protein